VAGLPAIASLLVAAAVAAQTSLAARPSPTPRSERITMQALHQFGGVPPGWVLEPPPGDARNGRKLYEQFGCHTCHAVRDSGLPPPVGPGPELTGMGGHHPPAYFAESMLNPDAVIVDGPNCSGADGRSNMPRYPDMTVAQLADLVAYLVSLNDGTGHSMASIAGRPAVDEADLPAAPPANGRRFLVQAYNVKPGQLGAFQDWFRREGAARFLALRGLVAIDTWVDRSGDNPRLISVFTFADEESFLAFTTDAEAQRVAERFDEFAGAHGHGVLPSAPLYRSEALSAHR